MSTPSSYLRPWNDSFPTGLSTDTFPDRARLAQAVALRVWAFATHREWSQNAALFAAEVNHWADQVPPSTRHAVLQDLLVRSLNGEGAVAAMPVLLALGASLVEPHPDQDVTHHPMHVALQPAHRNARVAAAVLDHLPERPFAQGADPFPGWSRARALDSLFEQQFSQKAQERAARLGLEPSPAEQALLMGGWLKQRQRKRCAIAVEQWGWSPEPTPALMESWWAVREWDPEKPDHPIAFDRKWAARHAAALTFVPAIRELTEARPFTDTSPFTCLAEFQRGAHTIQRARQWATLLPPSGDAQLQALEAMERLHRTIGEWSARLKPASGPTDLQAREAAILSLEMDVHTCRAVLNRTPEELPAPEGRPRARL